MAREGGHPPHEILVDTAPGGIGGGGEMTPPPQQHQPPPPPPPQVTPTNVSPPTPIPTVIADRFQVLRRIGGGSFGEIYEGRDMTNGEQIAIKFERLDSKHPQLIYEGRVIRSVHTVDQPLTGFPIFKWAGEVGNTHLAMVLNCLGPSLEDLFNYCDRHFSLKTVLQIADQMLARIATLHSRHFIHRDIKPDNFLIGTGNTATTVHVIDFGLSKRFRDPRTLQHIPFREGKNLTGTARYVSVNTHLGMEQSRRDDLESLGYVFMYFLRGSLPWQGLRARDKKQKYQRIMEKKMATNSETLCRGYPEELRLYLDYCKSLSFDEEPDYAYCRRLLRDAATRHGITLDGLFDWHILRPVPTGNPVNSNAAVINTMGGGIPVNPLPLINNENLQMLTTNPPGYYLRQNMNGETGWDLVPAPMNILPEGFHEITMEGSTTVHNPPTNNHNHNSNMNGYFSPTNNGNRSTANIGTTTAFPSHTLAIHQSAQPPLPPQRSNTMQVSTNPPLPNSTNTNHHHRISPQQQNPISTTTTNTLHHPHHHQQQHPSPSTFSKPTNAGPSTVPNMGTSMNRTNEHPQVWIPNPLPNDMYNGGYSNVINLGDPYNNSNLPPGYILSMGGGNNATAYPIGNIAYSMNNIPMTIHNGTIMSIPYVTSNGQLIDIPSHVQAINFPTSPTVIPLNTVPNNGNSSSVLQTLVPVQYTTPTNTPTNVQQHQPQFNAYGTGAPAVTVYGQPQPYYGGNTVTNESMYRNVGTSSTRPNQLINNSGNVPNPNNTTSNTVPMHPSGTVTNNYNRQSQSHNNPNNTVRNTNNNNNNNNNNVTNNYGTTNNNGYIPYSSGNNVIHQHSNSTANTPKANTTNATMEGIVGAVLSGNVINNNYGSNGNNNNINNNNSGTTVRNGNKLNTNDNNSNNNGLMNTSSSNNHNASSSPSTGSKNWFGITKWVWRNNANANTNAPSNNNLNNNNMENNITTVIPRNGNPNPNIGPSTNAVPEIIDGMDVSVQQPNSTTTNNPVHSLESNTNQDTTNNIVSGGNGGSDTMNMHGSNSTVLMETREPYVLVPNQRTGMMEWSNNHHHHHQGNGSMILPAIYEEQMNEHDMVPSMTYDNNNNIVYKSSHEPLTMGIDPRYIEYQADGTPGKNRPVLLSNDGGYSIMLSPGGYSTNQDYMASPGTVTNVKSPLPLSHTITTNNNTNSNNKGDPNNKRYGSNRPPSSAPVTPQQQQSQHPNYSPVLMAYNEGVGTTLNGNVYVSTTLPNSEHHQHPHQGPESMMMLSTEPLMAAHPSGIDPVYVLSYTDEGYMLQDHPSVAHNASTVHRRTGPTMTTTTTNIPTTIPMNNQGIVQSTANSNTLMDTENGANTVMNNRGIPNNNNSNNGILEVTLPSSPTAVAGRTTNSTVTATIVNNHGNRMEPSATSPR